MQSYRRNKLQTQQIQSLSAQQEAIVPIAVFAAAGEIDKLNAALQLGLVVGPSTSDCRKTLVQLYAFVGFPRSLNQLAELIKVLYERKQIEVKNIEGHAQAYCHHATIRLLWLSKTTQSLSERPSRARCLNFRQRLISI